MAKLEPMPSYASREVLIAAWEKRGYRRSGGDTMAKRGATTVYLVKVTKVDHPHKGEWCWGYV